MTLPESTSYFKTIEIEINHNCNLACPYCPNSVAQRKEAGEMSEEAFTAILHQLQDIRFEGKICYHFYNEPLLHPKLEKFISLSKALLPKSRSEIFTNGTLLTPEKFRLLCRAGADKFTVTRHLGPKQIQFEKTLAVLDEEERRKVHFLHSSQLLLSSRTGRVPYGPALSAGALTRPCFIPCSTLVVTVKGQVLPCFEDYDQQMVMGNVFEAHLRDIWNTEKYRSFRADLKKGGRANHVTCARCNNLQLI